MSKPAHPAILWFRDDPRLGDPSPAIPAPGGLQGAKYPPGGLAVAALDLPPQKPVPDWTRQFSLLLKPGEAGAAIRLRAFTGDVLGGFDPGGDYPREFVPRPARLPAQWTHRPWEAPVEVLRAAGVSLGQHSSEPVTGHATGPARALEEMAEMKRAAAG